MAGEGGTVKRVAASLEEVIQSAIELVSREGLSSLTMRALSDATGVSVGTLYTYFGDKTGLILRIMDSFWNTTLNVEVVRTVDKPLALPDMLEEVYGILRERSRLFHHDFIRDIRVVESLPAGHPGTRANYLMAVEEKLRDMVRRFPELDGRIREHGAEDQLVQFLLDNVMALLSRNAPDLGLFRDILAAYLTSLTSGAQPLAVSAQREQ